MVQVAVFGAYRAPREVNWWTGHLLALLLMGFALTGYLCPGIKGYWATQVATTLLGPRRLSAPRCSSLCRRAQLRQPDADPFLRAARLRVLPLGLFLALVGFTWRCSVATASPAPASAA